MDSLANLSDLPEGLEIESTRTPSRQDVRHRFTLSLIGQVPDGVALLAGFKASALIAAESGRFFNIFVGRDANADGNPNTDRPGSIGRNSYQGPSYATVDMRVAREIPIGERARVEVSVDVFNLLNRVNVKDVNTVWGGIDYNSPPAPQFGFGTARDVFNPRQAQIGVKVRW